MYLLCYEHHSYCFKAVLIVYHYRFNYVPIMWKLIHEILTQLTIQGVPLFGFVLDLSPSLPLHFTYDSLNQPFIFCTVVMRYRMIACVIVNHCVIGNHVCGCISEIFFCLYIILLKQK